MTKVSLSRDSRHFAKEAKVEWGDLPERRYIRVSDGGVWYVESFSPDGFLIRMHKTLGGDLYVGEYPRGFVNQIIRHDDEDNDANESGKPWKLVGLPHGVESHRRHLLDFHGIYETTTTSWQDLTRVHVAAHAYMRDGNGLVPHTHKEVPQIVWT